jgi:hypothetical protein
MCGMLTTCLKQLLRTYLGRSVFSADRAPSVDPRLAAILADEPDEAVQTCLDQSREKLQTLDVAAFWLQAVGDGTPLESGYTRLDAISPDTSHNVAWLAGYDNSLGFQSVAQITTQLFAHHLGVVTSPEPSVSDRAALDEVITKSTQMANTLYREVSPEKRPDPTLASLDAQVKRARSILDPDLVSHYWLQILCDFDDASVVIGLGATPGNDESPTAWIDHPIEYFVCIPPALSQQLEQILHLRSLGQHQFVGAHTTDQSIEQFGTQAREMTLDNLYLRNRPSEL